MRSAKRTLTAQATIAFLELLVGLSAILATVAVLLVAAVAVHAIGAGASRAGIGPAFGTVGTHLVAVAALLVLLAAARFVVVEYRRFLDRAPGPDGPILLAVGPLVGVTVPFGYAVYATASLQPPWPLLGVAVVSAHALAYRTIAAWSGTARFAGLGELAGVVAGVPTLVTLVTLLTEGVLFGPLDDAGRLLLATPGWGLLPRDGRFLVAFPLFVAVAFRVYRYLWRTDRVDVPDPDLPTVGVSVPDDWVRAVERRVSVPTLTDVALTTTDRLGDYVADRRRRTDTGVPPDAPPVPTPVGSRGSRSDGAGRDAPSGSPRESVDLGPRPPASPSSDASPSASSSSPSSSPEADPSTSDAPSTASTASTRSTADTSSSGSDTPGSADRARTAAGAEEANADPDGDDEAADSEAAESDADPASATEAPSTPTSDGEAPSGESSADEGDADSGSDEAASPGAAEGDDSQTRIYTPEPGSGDAAASDGAAVETCPACEADVPSDGTYAFCPLCGHEL
ncbi:MSCRAMM family adhesin SdrC [Halobacteria archaeon HArc-gm2]|nr:MSCRAMM family adhesin SdrC [Halobacteria archaeon HArc-gm2]